MLSLYTMMKQQMLQLLQEVAKNEFYTYIRMRSLDRAKAKAIVGIAHNQGLPFQVVQLDINGKIQ
jgi:hypothetical protein